MKQSFVTPFALVSLFGSVPVHALDAACQPIVDANKAQWRAPMVHDRKVLDDGFTYEIIKLGDALYMKSGGVWRTMPPAMTRILTDPEAIEKNGLQMKDCQQSGSEMVGSMPTLIYHFTSIGPNATKKARTSKVWIGRDGLPYRQEGETFKATMVYTGVTTPTVGK
jgi:hypothetical protein